MTTGIDAQLQGAHDGATGPRSETARQARERLVRALVDAMWGPAGRAPLSVRELAFARAQASATGAQPPASDSLRGAARELVDAVADRAHDVPAEMVEHVLAGGLSEHEAFDLIVAAALGAGLARREIGLEAIDGCLAAPAADGVLS